MSKPSGKEHQLRLAEKRRERKHAIQSLATAPQRSNYQHEVVAKLLLQLFSQHPNLTDRQIVNAIDATIHPRNVADPLTQAAQLALANLCDAAGSDRAKLIVELKETAMTIRKDFFENGPQSYLLLLQILAE